jgi:hypothetical protein
MDYAQGLWCTGVFRCDAEQFKGVGSSVVDIHSLMFTIQSTMFGFKITDHWEKDSLLLPGSGVQSLDYSQGEGSGF